MLKPKLFTTLKDYSWPKFKSDLVAGLVVGVVALPLAIAFAMASGVSPERGLFTAIIGGLVISVLGGSRVQIGGPTGAFVVVVYSIVHKFGMEGLMVATLMGGILLAAMGFFRFGSIVKFIPYPVIVGFTSGIALIIFSSQIRDFFGLPIQELPAEFVNQWRAYSHSWRHFNYTATAIGLGSLAIIFFWRRISQRIPGPLVALIFATLAVQAFHLPVETIGSRFGEIPHTLPHPVFPSLNLEMIRTLFPHALTIAVLAGIESLLSAVIADGMIGGKHRPNMELVAQGVANILSPLFGGMPATGAIARTTTNINNGGRTPVAGIIHALTLFIIMQFLGKWAVLIPLSCLAAILLVVAYHMSEWRSFLGMMRNPKSDVAVMLATFVLTVGLDLTVAIQVGMLLSLFLFVRRMAHVTNVGVVTRELVDEEETDDPNAIDKRKVPEGVEVYEINGPFFFGAAHKFMEAMKITGRIPKIRIVRMRNVPAIDATGIETLKEEYEGSKKQGIPFVLSEVHAQPLIALERTGLLERIGEENVFGNIDDSLDRARDLLGLARLERPTPFVPAVKRESHLAG